MASPASEPMSARKLTELRVIDLKAQLEKRGIERTGVKASLIDRLKKALEDEGHDADDYIFELDMRKLGKTDANDKEKMDGEEDDDFEMEALEADTTLTEESGVADLNKTPEVQPDEVEQNSQLVQEEEAAAVVEETTTDIAEEETKHEEEDPEEFALTIDDGVPSIDEDVEMDTKETESTPKEMEATSSTENQEAEEDSKASEGQTLAADAAPVSEPPSPSSVPVLAPFTSEDTFKMAVLSDRQMDEDISLIVHVDESQMDLDNDLLTPAKTPDQTTAANDNNEVETEKEETKGDAAGDEASTTTDKPTTSESDKSNNEIKEDKKEDAGVTEEQKTALSKDGDKAKSASAPKVPAKDVPASSRNLWISGLATTTRATDLKTLFTKYGKVAGAKVVTNAKSPGSRCYGFVTMSTADEASKCIQHLHRTELHGKMISVERAKTDPSAQAKIIPKAGPDSQRKDAHPRDRDDRRPGPRRSGGYPGDRNRRPRSRSRDRHERRPSGHRRTPPPANGASKPDAPAGKEKECLDFDKIKAEREQERLRERERRMRVEERRRMNELERMRQNQREVERRQREESVRLEREKQRLKLEQQRLELERLEAERERIALERERQRRERERLEKEREQERQAQLRMEQERRAMKRNFESRGPAAREDNYWNDAKRANLDRSASAKNKGKDVPSTAQRGSKHEERGNAEFERRVERYDRRTNEQPQRGNTERYDNRREERHDTRRDAPPAREGRDRDDRGGHAQQDRQRNAHETNRYEARREAAPTARTHEPRVRHERTSAPRTAAPPRSSPAHRQPDSRAEWKSERPSAPSRESTRERRPAPANERSFPDARAATNRAPQNRAANSRENNWHNSRGAAATQEERGKGHNFSSGAGLLGNAPAMTDHQHQWSSTDRNTQPAAQTISARPGERSWGVTANQPTERVGARAPPSALAVQQPLLQTPPTSAAFLASAANIMMGVGLAGNRNAAQDTRYDAYKNMQGGNVRRY